MRVGVVGGGGGGVVGRATAKSFVEHVDEVRVYDVLAERRTHGYREVLACDVVFVCLPTPQESPLRALNTFFSQVSADVNYVIRSTVPVGTTAALAEQYRLTNVVHSPEFLTARCAEVDAQMPTRNIVGGDIAHPVSRLYMRRWPHVPILYMTSDESEAVKLMLNSFFAVKVAFWNEMRTFADECGLDWIRVMQGILTDGRVHPSHTNVPGPDGSEASAALASPRTYTA